MLKLVRELCSLNGVSGWEDAVREFIIEVAGPYADDMHVDAMGNVILFKRGNKATGKKLLLTAHMDEVGLMISHVTEEGYLKFQCVGGIDRRVLMGRTVCVGPENISGIIGVKPVHLTDSAQRRAVPKLDSLYIDIGASSRNEAEKLVSLGDTAAFSGECVEFGAGMIKAKALDDRIGCAVLLKILKEDLPMDCTFAFTVQEEVGTRGAFGAAFSAQPEVALIVEGTTAADLPGTDESKKVCVPGMGPVLPYMDGTTIYDKELYRLLCELAENNAIPWQTKRYISGGTDARSIQRSKAGVRVAGVACAVRNIHSPASVAAISDFEPVLDLTRHFIHAIAKEC